MHQVKIRRIFPRNRFYVGVLLDWKESVVDRNIRSVLCRALINLRAYPLDIVTFTDLKNIRGIGDQIARKLEEAWNAFCSQNLVVPNLKQILQMKKGEFLQFLNHPNSLEKNSVPPRTVQLCADNIKLSKSENAKHCTQHVDVANLKPSRNYKRKCLKIADQPVQLPKKAALKIEDSSSASVTTLHSNCREVQCSRKTNYSTDECEVISSVANDGNKIERGCSGSQESDDNIACYPSAFGNTAKIILIIDNRESASTRKFQQICRLLDKKRILYEMRSLSVGDYLWIMRLCDNRELVLDTIVERKTVDDLRSSIVQKRYEEQKQRLVSAGIPNIVYILEGSILLGAALEQALVTTYVENQFLIYRTSDVQHTSLILSKITERLVRKATTQEFTGISYEKFQRTSRKTQRRSVKDVFLRQLVVCPQISVHKASLIVDRFPSFTALTDFYASLPNEEKTTALFENFLGITKGASAHMANFYFEI